MEIIGIDVTSISSQVKQGLNIERTLSRAICTYLYKTVSFSGKASEQEAGVDPKGSNELLFSLLFEKFRAIHDREHFLSSEVAVRYLDQMCARPRDLTQHPFPFRCRTAASPCQERPGFFEVCFAVMSVMSWNGRQLVILTQVL